GQGVEQDYAEAAKWYRKLAESGDNLSYAMLKLDLLDVDESSEIVWREVAEGFRKAAEQGNASAQHELGRCYYNGQGVERDHAAAAGWFRKAAEQGAR
ncbi:MAG: tetratricopeptide repeat protein, partial [Phycisphaerae bacterium]